MKACWCQKVVVSECGRAGAAVPPPPPLLHPHPSPARFVLFQWPIEGDYNFFFLKGQSPFHSVIKSAIVCMMQVCGCFAVWPRVGTQAGSACVWLAGWLAGWRSVFLSASLSGCLSCLRVSTVLGFNWCHPLCESSRLTAHPAQATTQLKSCLCVTPSRTVQTFLESHAPPPPPPPPPNLPMVL